MQVASVFPSWHAVPAMVQIEDEQVHAAMPADTVQLWCTPQVAEPSHCVQPLACLVHVSTPPPPTAHRLTLSAHASMHVVSVAASVAVSAATSVGPSVGVLARTSE
jgi:hypothetical protein